MDDLRPTASLRSALSPRVVGRDAELSVLLEHVDEAEAGRGGVVFLVGEAGIGKSRLAQAAVDEANGAGFGLSGDGQFRRPHRSRTARSQKR